jgi:uncharacterized membrane protein YciS (DUF1049 family)
MFLFSTIAVLIIVLVAVIFATQNAVIIPLIFLSWQFQGSLALILFLAFIIGFILGVLIVLPKWIGKKPLISNQKKKIEGFKSEENIIDPEKPENEKYEGFKK